MDQIKLAEFAKSSENKEGPEFTAAVQEAGIAQGSLIVSRLFNTMLGDVTRVMKSWNEELVNVLGEVGIMPSALTNEQLLAAFIAIVKKYSGGTQLGDLVPNIGTTSPIGRVLCNGARLQNCKTLFPDFYNYVLTSTPYKTVAQFNQQVSTYGQCGFCAVDGDDVVVPLITRPISGVSNLSQTGQAVSDTMRPITGGVCKVSEFLNEGDTRWTNGAFERGTYGDAGSGNGVKGGAADPYTTIKMNSGRLGAAYNGTETRGKQVQYPYYIQIYTAASSQAMVDTAALVEMLKYQNQLGIIELPTGGTINLASGGIYRAVISQDTTFVLPEVTDNTLLNQILIQLEVRGTPSINWGTTNFFSGEPSVAEGNYNIVYEYDLLVGGWVIGQIEKVVS